MPKDEQKTALIKHKSGNAGGAPPVHGVYGFLESKRIHPSIRGRRKIKKELAEYRRGLMQQYSQGGQDPPPSMMALISQAVFLRTIVLLIGEYANRTGVIDPRALQRKQLELMPILGRNMLSYVNSERLVLQALDQMAGKAAPAQDTLAEYIEIQDKGKAAG